MKKVASVPIFICLILLLSFWVRIQGVDNLPSGQFTETDAYFYYWQAGLISEHGQLPLRDMHRWLPLGRDLGQTLNLYGYVLAYTHKAVATVFANISLYQVCFYMPVICFCIGLASLCLFLYHTHGLLFSCSVGILLATLPGSIERSAAGFGDRDAFCLMIGLLAVITYLTSLQAAQPLHHRLFWTLFSGFTVFLGGISWEGFGVFLTVILCVEIWRFLTSETEGGLGFYLLWVLCFVPTLFLVSPAYRSGYGFAKHLFAFVLVPPTLLLGIRMLRHLILLKVEKLRLHARTLALGLTLASVMFSISYVWIQLDTFADTTVPISQNAVMQSMTELRTPHYGYWVFRYGGVFLAGSLGFILIPVSLWKKQGILFSIPIALFTLFSFFRQHSDKLWGEPIGNILFYVTIAGCAVVFLFVAWRRQLESTSEWVFLAFIIYFLMWVALSRDAKRYDFFIGVALSYGSATLIQHLAEMFSEKLQDASKASAIKAGAAMILLTFLMCLPIKNAHTYRSLYAAKEMRKAVPGNTAVAKTFYWMKAHLPRTAVVAANWRYGSQLNVIGGVKTITDQDTYLQHWIDLYYRHVIFAKTERETLEFLKTHHATHLMLVGDKPAKHFLNEHLSEAFLPIYPTENFADADVNIWELHYPPDIHADVKYLKTGFPEIDAHLQLSE
ncbi:MAG: hypothetical protein OXG97_04375 [Candidatus Poribacteria bacterium]|nr:hypothetical protein [Candidatus Poribacteria bacterium]